MGQVSAQEPQSMQASLITYCVSPWEIAPMGHPSAQEPQEMQASLITYILISSFFNFSVLESLLHFSA